jgi:primosomal protein N' (replication factor Y)
MVLADIGLLLPDFRAPERVFQVLLQVAGRAGRADRPGKAVLQTYRPEHYALTRAAAHDYPGFAEEELKNRRRLGYPPFQKLARMVFNHPDESEARRKTEAMAETLRAHIVEQGRLETSLIGPAPCFFGKIRGRYRWQIVVRGPDPAALIDFPIPDGWQIDVDPVTLL